MRPAVAMPYAVVIVIILAILLTGPLMVGPQSPDYADEPVGGGSADVTIISPPANGLSIQKSQFGGERYVLRAPSVTVDVANVTGRPMLTYKVQATNLGFSRSEILFLSPEVSGTQKITFSEETFAPSRVTKDSYQVELFVVLRASGEETLYYENVTVQVED